MPHLLIEVLLVTIVVHGAQEESVGALAVLAVGKPTGDDSEEGLLLAALLGPF